MRRKTFWSAASCILAVVGLLPAFCFGSAPASTEKVLYSFAGGTDGANPVSDLTLDNAGNLYGTTTAGGTGTVCNGGCGTVFELKRTNNGWTEQVLYSFTGGKDGGTPESGLIFDNSGTLYGTTESGGMDNAGAIFKLTPNSKGGWTESVIYSFTGLSDGFSPQTDLVFDAHGNLFGTTEWGGIQGSACGNNGCGAVFELIPQSNGSWKEVTVYDFAGEPDGAWPSSPIVLDSLGNLFGMTKYGGTGKCNYTPFLPGCGIVYELAPNSSGGWTETVIHDLVRGGGFGTEPSSGLILEGTGDLLGTTSAGGDGLGTVFELNHGQKGWGLAVSHRFYGNPDGIHPIGKLEINAEGAVFGATESGGAHKIGVVFELRRSKANSWKERILYSFTGSGFNGDGSSPAGGVVSDSHGHLYGTTVEGGSGNCDCGTVFEVTP
jgi:uncharacterized repeat protein (TIGR03803 family)